MGIEKKYFQLKYSLIGTILSNNNISSAQQFNTSHLSINHDCPISPITNILSTTHVTTQPIYQVSSTTMNHQTSITTLANQPIPSIITTTTDPILIESNVSHHNTKSYNTNGKRQCVIQTNFRASVLIQIFNSVDRLYLK